MLFRAGRNLIRGLILIACVGLPSTEDAAAADIPYPVKAPAVVDVPPSWDGFYLGGQVGYGMDSVGWRNLGSSALFSPLNSLTRDRGGGVIGGGQVGYNFQFNRIVFQALRGRYRRPTSTDPLLRRISPPLTYGLPRSLG